ncbi:MAG: peptide chain release factor N(5)-glutamine methyltransferase [Kiritimatiellae bacterium]|nr:peptide chain release factor N(5)-glutamine methyltransferase [Kiritimatiellia bacterium]
MSEPVVADILFSAARSLEAAGLDEARLKAEWALSRALGFPRLEWPLRFREAVPASALSAFESYVRRLAGREPLQYVLGDAEFMGLVLKTDRRALIPRPETEFLVETVLEYPPLWAANRRPVVADVGTGTGCIALALASKRPGARCLARDSSPAALDLARENAAALGLEGRIEFEEGDLLEGVPPGSLDAVVSNPPYVPAGDWAGLDRSVRDFEPRGALDGGADGLAVIRRLLPQAFTSLKERGIVALEIGEGQAERVRRLMKDAGFVAGEIRRDFSDRDRVALGIKE